jgi:hypothetical protein
VTDEAGHCSFCGATRPPSPRWKGCSRCGSASPAWRSAKPTPPTRLGLYDPGPYPLMSRAEMRESLALLPSWVLEQKAAANRQLIAVMRQRLAAGEQVARMYQEPGLAWLERQAEAAEQLLAERQAGDQNQ